MRNAPIMYWPFCYLSHDALAVDIEHLEAREIVVDSLLCGCAIGTL